MIKQTSRRAKYYTFLLIIVVLALGPVQRATVQAAPPRQEGQDIALITQPVEGESVQGVVSIVGTATHPAFNFYVVEISPRPGEQWQFVGDGQTPVINGQLTTWDTNTVPDGTYAIRLRVVYVDGNFSEAPLREVVVTNTQPLPTNTPEATPTEEGPAVDIAPGPPTATPTPLPPTPTILVEQPVVDTPTPRPAETTVPLQNPDEPSSFVPTVSGFSLLSLRDACLYGGGLMLAVFLLFGFLAALRTFIQGFVDRVKQRS